MLAVFCGTLIWIVTAHAQAPATTTPAHSSASLATVRLAIEKKDMEKAVRDLKALYPARLQNAADVERVSQWMSLFLYDETVAYYEKAVELAAKNDPGAEESFRKALAKEPHNKLLQQSLITYFIDQKKMADALTAITSAESKYPYFKVFSLYRRYVQPAKTAVNDKRAAVRDQKTCVSSPLSADAMDFCRAVLLREAVANKVKFDKKTVDELKSIRYPEALFSLWEMTSDVEYLKQYISKCRALSDQEKRLARLFPGVCSKVNDVEPLLKTQDPED